MKLPFSNYIKAHHISHAALSVCAVAAAVLFFVVGAGIRLLVGPVSLGPLQETLAGAIQAALPGITLQYDKAAIEWDREQDRISLVVLGTRILDQDGKVVASAPKADIDLAAGSFLHGKFAVRRITLVGVAFRLVHMKGGGIRLGDEGGKANDVYERLSDVIEAKGSNTSSLKSFAVRDAHLVIYDEVTGLSLTAPRANLSITARANSLATDFESDVNVGTKPAHVKADLILPADTGPITGSATISHLDLAALSANAPLFRPLHLLALSTDLSTRFSIAPGGHITETDFDLQASGNIPFDAVRGKLLHVQQLRLTGHYDGAKKHLALTQAMLDAREASLRLKGGADFIYANGALDSISADLSATRAGLNLPGILPAPVQLQSAVFKGLYHAGPRSFDISQFDITAPGFAAGIKGAVQLGNLGQSPGMELTGSIAQIPARTLLRYWPLQLAPGARGWIDRDIFEGVLGPIAFETHFAPGTLNLPWMPDNALTLTFPMQGVEGNYMDGLTHLTGVSGNGTVTGDNFKADFSGGKVGNLTISDGHALIPNFHIHGTVGQFNVHINGAMPDVMALIDMKPLNYPTKFGIDPKTTLGNASIDLAMQVPMLEHNADSLGILVKAHVDNFAVALGKLHIGNGDVDFAIDNKTLHQTGTVQLADSKVNVDWVEDLDSNLPMTTHLTVKGELTEAVRSALNINLSSILTGPVGAQGLLTGRHGQLRTADMQLDLTPAAIMVPVIHLGKPAGQAATGHVTIDFGANNNLQDETIHVTGPNLAATGTANFDKNGGLTVVNFSSVKMGPLNDLSFVLTRMPQGDTYTLRGHSLDGSLVGRNPNATPATSPGVNASAPAQDDTPVGFYHIDAKLDRVAMRDNIWMAPFSMDLTGMGSRPATLSLSGALTQDKVARTAPITASVVPTAQGRQMTLNADDAGMLIRGLFAFESLRGGKMTLTAFLPGRATDTADSAGPDYSGKLDINDFTMVNQPFLARLFSAGSLTGVGDLMGGNGITVDNLDVPFSSKNNVISVKNSVVRGPAVGATIDGYIDRPKNMVAIKGDLAPLYGLNSVMGHIPILGDILAPKKGAGMIGMTYSVSGNADQPNIDVNYISALAPGFLRNVFQGHVPGASDAPSNKAASDAPSNKSAPAAPPATAQAASPALKPSTN